MHESKTMVHFIRAALLGFLFFYTFCSSEKAPNYTFMHQATTAADVSYYDYIIIGGGTAGCPLAATLSQNYKVLLLERGDSPYGNPNITWLSGYGAPLSDSSPTSPSQRFISEDGVINARARVLGGGTSINSGFYSRAAVSFVKTAGLDGKLVNESYAWVEKKLVFKPVVKQWQSAVRDGLVEVGVVPNNGFTYDHLIGTKVSGTIFDPSGRRHTAADLLEYANPSRLNVLLHASAHRILFRAKGKSRPTAHGVVFRDATGRKHKAYLNKGGMNEIIVSAGAVGSPHMLMLSGIGPAEQLKAHNISVILDQPMVGQGLSDNPMNLIMIPSPIPVEISVLQVVGITRFGSFIEAASGKSFVGGPNPFFKGGYLWEKIMGPLSKGHLELKTRNLNDNPSVIFNYFKEPEDLKRCVEGLKLIERVIESKSFSKFRYDTMSMKTLLNMSASVAVNLLPRHNNVTESLEQFCKDTVMTVWHYHGGCQVGKVVDQDYKVIGIDALRVVDGSTLIDSPGTNPQATLMMLGRYVGVRILNERLAKKI